MTAVAKEKRRTGGNVPIQLSLNVPVQLSLANTERGNAKCSIQHI